MRKIVALVVLLSFSMHINAYAQKRSKPAKAEAPTQEAEAPPAECVVAYYIEDSVGLRLPKYKSANDSLISANKQLEQCRLLLDTITDMKLVLGRDSLSLTKGDYLIRNNEIRKAETRYKGAFNDASRKKENAENILVPIRNEIRKKADTICIQSQLKNLSEINQLPVLKCKPEQTVMIDITSYLIAEFLKPQ